MQEAEILNDRFTKDGPFGAPPPGFHKQRRRIIWGALGTAMVLSLTVAFLLNRIYNNSAQRLEVFPVDEYLENFSSLTGAHFKAKLRFQEKVKWKDTEGGVVVFRVDEGEKNIVALVSPELSKERLEEGKTISAELFISDGGLVKVVRFLK